MASNAPAYSLKEISSNCIYLIRMIRGLMLQMHQMLEHKPDSVERRQAFCDKIHSYIKKVEESYIQIEGAMKQCQERFIATEKLNNVQALYDEEMENFEVSTTLDSLVDAENWSECKAGTYVNFLFELMKHGVRRRTYNIEKRVSSPTKWGTEREAPQVCFEKGLRDAQGELRRKKSGIWPKLLERTPFGCVVEVKYGNVVENQIVIIQKLILVVNNGLLDHILWIAPNEEFSYTDDYGTKRLDILQQSTFILYQKLSEYGNSTLLPYANGALPHNERWWNGVAQLTLFHLLSRYNHIFELKCNVCRKVMKDFLPCTVIDLRNRSGYHESCR